MNSASKHAVTALLVILMAGCDEKKAKTVPPAQAQAPAIPAAGKAGAMYPPPLTESQTQTEQPAPAPPPVVAQSQPTPPPQPPPPSTKKSTSHKSKPSAAKPGSTQPGSPDTATPAQGSAATPSTQTEPATEVAASGEPAAASPIGELTPGGTAGQAEKGKETNDLITNTENGLNAIKRPLSTQEQETASQIRTFLTKARTALSSADLDGAYILATKAKVLLDELNKS
jgi:hypothetical protein